MSMPFHTSSSSTGTIIFPSIGMQALSSAIHLVGVSVLAFCLARRVSFDNITTLRGWTCTSWARFCVILVLIDSWLFVFVGGLLIGGIGLSLNESSCSFAIFLCIVLYALSKIFIYLFLVEKVHVVWSAGVAVTRWQSTVYRLCMGVMTIYLAIFILMVLGRVSFFQDDGTCVIGLKGGASIPLLAYDLFLNVFLTGMFVWPILRAEFANPKIRQLAIRTLMAAAAALTTSSVNIVILTSLHGEQLGWVCLGSCGTDVTINAIVLFFVTLPQSSHPINESISLPHVPPLSYMTTCDQMNDGGVSHKSEGEIVHDGHSPSINKCTNRYRPHENQSFVDANGVHMAVTLDDTRRTRGGGDKASEMASVDRDIYRYGKNISKPIRVDLPSTSGSPGTDHSRPGSGGPLGWFTKWRKTPPSRGSIELGLPNPTPDIPSAAPVRGAASNKILDNPTPKSPPPVATRPRSTKSRPKTARHRLGRPETTSSSSNLRDPGLGVGVGSLQFAPAEEAFGNISFGTSLDVFERQAGGVPDEDLEMCLARPSMHSLTAVSGRMERVPEGWEGLDTSTINTGTKTSSIFPV